MINSMTVQDALNRNGIIIERARREGRSLTAVERNIIAAGRNLAADKRVVRHRMNAMEMDGERNWEMVLKPIKVVAVFSYYDDPFEEIPASAHYVVRESNHPGLPEMGHVGAVELQEAGIRIPETPTFNEWVKAGRKVIRK